MDADEIEATIIEALDNAKENGFEPHKEHYAVVALDLQYACGDLENTPLCDMYVAIKTWQDRNK